MEKIIEKYKQKYQVIMDVLQMNSEIIQMFKKWYMIGFIFNQWLHVYK